MNNDLDEGLLRLNLSGVVGAPAPQPAPEIDLALDGQSIGDGGTLDFGSTIQRDAVNLTITVTNLGSIRLHLTPLNPASMPSGFSLLSNIDSTSLAPGESTSIMLRFNAATVGFISGAFHLVNSDSDEGSYDVAVSGTAIAPLRQLVDDGDNANLLNGLWCRPTGSGYERDTHYSARGNGSKFSTWYFNVPSGQYRVFATWTWNKHHASTRCLRSRGFQAGWICPHNQRAAPGPQSSIGRWRLLGTVTLINGGLTVKLTNAANGYVIADAVRVEQAGGYRSPPEILMTLAPTANAVALGSPKRTPRNLFPQAQSFCHRLLRRQTRQDNQRQQPSRHGRPASKRYGRRSWATRRPWTESLLGLAMSDSHSLISSVDLIVSGERDEAS